MSICEILKALRTENGLTQNELAKKLNIGQATIACYENGQREPLISNLIAYADYFECSLDYIAGRADDFGNIYIDVQKSKNGDVSLTENERAVLENYRKLSEKNKLKAEGYLEGLKDN